MADQFVLTEESAKILQRLLDDYGRGRKNRPGLTFDSDDYNTPDVYVARTPGTGIPALRMDLDTGTGTRPIGTASAFQGNTPGSAECNIYRVLYTSTTPNLMPVGITRAVLNLSTTAVAANSWVIVIRDKFGQWYVLQMGSGGEAGATITVRSRDSSSGSSVYTTFTSINTMDFWLTTGVKATLAAAGRILIEMVAANYPSTWGVVTNTSQIFAGPKTVRVGASEVPITAWMDSNASTVGAQTAYQIVYDSTGTQVMAWNVQFKNVSPTKDDVISRMKWKTRDGTEGGLFQAWTEYTDSSNWFTSWTWSRLHNGSVPSMGLDLRKSSGTEDLTWIIQVTPGYISFNMSAGNLTTNLGTADSGTYGSTGYKGTSMGLKFNAGFCTGSGFVSTPLVLPRLEPKERSPSTVTTSTSAPERTPGDVWHSAPGFDQ